MGRDRHALRTVMPDFRIPTLVLASIVLAAACTPPEEAGSTAAAKAEPPPAEAKEPAPAKAEPAPVKGSEPPPAEGVEPAPARVEPSPTPAVPSEPIAAGPLRVVAVREGDIELLRQRDAPLLVIDGEPVAFVDGAFARHPVGSAGLWSATPPDSETTVTLAAVSLEEPLGAWVTVEHEGMRSASHYAVYHRDGQAWRQQKLGQGLIVGFHSAFVERDGALLALRGWAPEPNESNRHMDGEGPAAEAYEAKLDRALDRAEHEWVRIAGSETAVIPEIPANVGVGRGVKTLADGSLVALAQESMPDGSGGSRMLLTWRPGKAEPERTELPEAKDTNLLSLASSDGWSMIGGATDEGGTYLALGGPEPWARVPVALPGRPSSASVAISGAARLPDGELWIALGDPFSGGGDRQPVWRKPVDGPWTPVVLPTVESDAFGPAEGWARDGTADERGWVSIQRTKEAFVPEQSLGLLSAGGAIWIVVQGQYATSDVGEAAQRTVVLTTAPGTAPPVVLPAEWTLALERRNHGLRATKPGRKGCEGFTIELGPAALAEGSPTLATTIAAVALDETEKTEPAKIVSVYVAKRGAGEVLVAEARAGSPARADALREAVLAAMSTAGVATDAVASACRIPAIERMVAPAREP